jgi:hypothetical protein
MVSWQPSRRGAYSDPLDLVTGKFTGRTAQAPALRLGAAEIFSGRGPSVGRCCGPGDWRGRLEL